MKEPDLDWDLIDTLLADLDEWTEQAEVLLLGAEKGLSADEISTLFRAYHSIKGATAFFPFLVEIKGLTHKMEDVLASWRDGSRPVTRRGVSALLRSTQLIRRMAAPLLRRELPPAGAWEDERKPLLGELSELMSSTVGLDEQTRKELIVATQRLSELPMTDDATIRVLQHLESQLRLSSRQDEKADLPAANAAREMEATVGSSAQTESALGRSSETGGRCGAAIRTLRVGEAQIDEFLRHVGELITIREIFGHFGRRLESLHTAHELASEFHRLLASFSTHSRDLQESLMAVRKVSMKSLLQRLPRVAYDVAAATEKKVRTELSGVEQLVDKRLLELLESPLTHIVRNAVDHGIEAEEVRLEAGKPPSGKLTIRAFQEDGSVCIEVRDDGRGIDRQRLCEKAVEQGLVARSAAASLSQVETCRLLFLPGLSTAETVTDISGRGVGMDVVARNLRELGGSIDVASEVGEGTTFLLRLPVAVTVNIVEGFVVRVRGQEYVLPLSSVKESFSVDDEIEGLLLRGGRVLPIVDLCRCLYREGGQKSERRIVVVLRLPCEREVGMIVDAVSGIQQLVIRDVPSLEDFDAPFSGGAILGNGRVALVLDLERLECFGLPTFAAPAPGLGRSGVQNEACIGS